MFALLTAILLTPAEPPGCDASELHAAARRGDADEVRGLLDRGGAVDARDKEKRE